MKKQDIINIIKKYDNIVIYGAQKIAVATAVYLTALRGDLKKDYSIVVSSKVGNPSYILGHEVQVFKDALKEWDKEKTFVFIAARKYQSDIENVLECEKISNHALIDYGMFRDRTLLYQNVLTQSQYSILMQMFDDPEISDEEIAFYLGKVEYKLTIDIQIVGHCNLNCQSCNVFSPLVSHELMSIATYERDLLQLRTILDEHQLQRITLIGGEPLLHPQINEFMRIGRMIFPEVDINIFTNGIKLLEMEEDFFQTCIDNNINITFTKYPIDVNYDLVKEKLEEMHIDYRIFNGETEEKESHKVPICLEGNLSKEKTFFLCHRVGFCELKNGKIYPCSLAPSFYRFCNYFNISQEWGKEDGVDIYKCKNYDELMEKITQPMESCKYCGVCKTQYGIKWDTSKRNISEWV